MAALNMTSAAVVVVAVLTATLAPVPAAPPQFLTAPTLSPEDTERVRIYYEAIGRTVPSLATRVALADLVRPILQLAATRSTDDEAAGPAENRAALIALAFYTNGIEPGRLINEARTWPRPAWRRLLLRGRGDLAQHFTVSAAIAAAAGAPIAHAIGVYKELEDARRGGGFSFSDLTADRAGTTFGERATTSADSARRLQGLITDALLDAHIMPPVDGLPADLPDAEFARRYRGENEARYHAVVSEIDKRIAALAIFAQ